MPSLINRVPSGLLSLLGIKALGQNPNQLSDLVQPTFDLSAWYASGFTQLETDTSALITAPGLFPAANAIFEPAAGQLLLCVGASVITDAALGAGTTMTFTPVVSSTTGRVTAVFGPATSAAAAGYCVSGTDQFVIVPPGYRLGVMVSQLTLGVQPRARFSARVVRLEI